MGLYRAARNEGYSRGGAAIIQAGAAIGAITPVTGALVASSYISSREVRAALVGVSVAAGIATYILGVHYTQKAVDFLRNKISKLESE